MFLISINLWVRIEEQSLLLLLLLFSNLYCRSTLATIITIID